MARIVPTAGGYRLLPVLGILSLLGCEIDPLQTRDREFTLIIQPQTAEVDVADETEFTAFAVSLQGDTLTLPLTWSIVGDSGATVMTNSGKQQKIKTGQFVGSRAGDWEVAVEDASGLTATARIRVRKRIRFDHVNMEQVHTAPDTAVVRYEIMGRRSTRLACIEVQLVRLTPGVHLERADCPPDLLIHDLMVVDPRTRETLNPRELIEEVQFTVPQETLNQVLSARQPVPSSWWGGA